MLREVRELGFEYAELSHGTRISLVPGILEAVDAGEMKISSVHIFCPLPMGVNHAAPNIYQFSAEREREREMAETLHPKNPGVRHARGGRSRRASPGKHRNERLHRQAPGIGRARREGNTALRETLHGGGRKTREQKGTLLRAGKGTPEKTPAGSGVAGPPVRRENRESLEELPLDSDFHFLFRELSSPHLGYRHDTGHAQIKDNLGFIHHRMHLESLSEQLVGLHIHDVQFPGRDHCAPGKGVINFAELKPLLKPHHIRVLELSPSLPVEDLRAGVAHIKALWGE